MESVFRGRCNACHYIRTLASRGAVVVISGHNVLAYLLLKFVNFSFKKKLAVAVWISRLPLGRLRVFLYRVLLGYRIDGGWIGRGSVIAVDEFVAEDIQIGNRNRIVGPFAFNAGKGCRIGHDNEVSCENWVMGAEFRRSHYARKLVLGDRVMFTSGHFVDVVGEVRIGDQTWLAGRGSQIWSHGLGVVERDVRIGANCYIGSAVRICPGASVPDDSVLAMGSVLTKTIGVRKCLIGGVPAKVIREDYIRPIERKIESKEELG